ncbi:MAG: S8 family serine peptidase [Acidimicrobiales bacterium]
MKKLISSIVSVFAVWVGLGLLSPLPMAFADDECDDECGDECDDDDECGDELGVVPGEFIVVVAANADPQQVAASVGAVVSSDVSVGDGNTLHFALDPDVDTESTLDVLRNTPGVLAAEPNAVVTVADFLGLRQRFFADLGTVVVEPDGSRFSVNQIALSASNPTSHGLTGNGVLVAVLDTGVDRSHPILEPRLSANGYDFVDGDLDPSEETDGIDNNGNGAIDEAFGHGTFVAGVVALVAPQATILPIRILDSDGTTDSWTLLRGLAFASAADADVINLSLGGANLGPLVEEEMERVREEGAVIVAAAGNDGVSAEQLPAAYEDVLSVGAIDGATGLGATFSNVGSWVDVAAPGVGIVSTYPEGRFATWGGTSASSPVVAGLLALIEEAAPGAPGEDLIDHVTASSNLDGDASATAYGRIDIGAATSRALSHGRAAQDLGGSEDPDD